MKFSFHRGVKFVSTLLVLALFIAITSYRNQTIAQSTKPNTAQDLIRDASNTVGFDIYQKLVTDPSTMGKNLLYSPYSISTAFSMLMEGTRGQTTTQLAASLHLSDRSGAAVNPATLHDGVGSLRKRLAESTSEHGFQLFSANAIWLDRAFTPKAEFIRALEQFYGMRNPDTLDFRSNPRAAREKINAWGEEQTRGKIKQMLAADPPSNTAMVLANTVYLKTTWLKPFDPSATKTKPFHIDRDPSHDVQVPMMRQVTEDTNPYYENDDFQMTLLCCGYWKHEGNGINAVIPAYMLLILPKRIDGLADVERSLTWDKLDRLTSSFDKAMVTIDLPKFKFNTEIDLKRIFGQLGATNAFDPAKADLSGMAQTQNGNPLYITSATHRAVIDVDETGIEAAAESMMMGSLGIPPKRAEFRADHPFLFLVCHSETDATLFMGRAMNPAP